MTTSPHAMRFSTSKLSRPENGQVSPNLREIRDLIAFYDATEGRPALRGSQEATVHLTLLTLLTVCVITCGGITRESIRARTARHGHITAAVRDVACRWIDRRDGRGRSHRR